MSIINDALKKLQNQIDDNESSISTLVEKNDLTATQQEGFRSTMTEEPISTQESATQKPAQKRTPPKAPQESHLAMVLIILCLLTGLFIPVFNKQSIVTIAFQQISQLSNHFQKRSVPEIKHHEVSKTDEFPNAMAVASHTAAQAPVTVQETVTPPVVSTTPAEVPVPATASKPVRAQSRLIINGIMTQGDKNLVLIDGQIYEEGDTVDGVEIIKVTPKGVDILENGEQRFLKVMGL